MGRNSQKRTHGFKKPKTVFYIVAEGKNTEKRYLNAFKKKHGFTNIHLRFNPKAGKPPLDLQKQMIGLQNQYGAPKNNDPTVFWLVFDKDDHQGFDEVAKNSVPQNRRSSYPTHVAFSNPCFEVWLLWHFQDSIPSHDRHMIQKTCNDVANIDTKKCSEDDFAAAFFDCSNKLESAINLAKQHYNPDTKPSNQIPCSTVFKLIESICEKETNA